MTNIQKPSNSDRKQLTSQTLTNIPRFKMLVSPNAASSMFNKSQEQGLWRRIRVVDFEHLFTK